MEKLAMTPPLFAFEPILLEKMDAYRQRLSQTPQKGSDYSSVNLWGWKEAYDLQWAWHDPLIWIRQNRPGPILWAPVGPWGEIDWPLYFQHLGNPGIVFTRVPEQLLIPWKIAFPGRLHFEEERGNWDYLYRMEDMVLLKGNRFHQKKNLVNQFIKKFTFEYVPLDDDRIADALLMQESWCTWHDCESSEVLDAENQAIARVLGTFSHFRDLFGGGILCKGKMIAYTLGERLDSDTLLIHFEKGDPGYPGVYQTINQLFLSHHVNAFRMVNREQDLDNPGLRKAKLSYHPVDFVRKYRVSLEKPGEKNDPSLGQ